MANTETNFQNQATQIWNLEVQVGQLANMLNGHQQGNLPCTTEVNPKEQCKAITLRSERELETYSTGEKANKDGQEQTETILEAKPLPPQEPGLKVHFPQHLRKSKLEKQFAKF